MLFQLTASDLILVALPFRTVKECVSMTQNVPRLCVASVWSENSTVCLELTNMLSCQTIFINCHHEFDPCTATGRVHSGTGQPGIQVCISNSFLFKNSHNKTKSWYIPSLKYLIKE